MAEYKKAVETLTIFETGTRGRRIMTNMIITVPSSPVSMRSVIKKPFYDSRCMVRDRTPRTKTIFFIVFIITGIAVSCFSAYFLVFPSLVPRLSTVNPNYSGLGTLVNKTNVSPYLLVVIASAEPNELFFQYYFNCDENGTYNFLLSFPFNMSRKISSQPENMSFNYSSSYGTAIWSQYYSNGTGSRSISGNFEIEDTFRSGSGGYYTFVLPFGFGVNSQEIFGNLTSELNVTFAPGVRTDLYFNVDSSKYEITQTFPERKGGWLTMPDRPINWTGAAWELQEGLSQSFIIYCRNPGEIRGGQVFLFLGGVILSIGIQIAIGGGYDLAKERFGHDAENIVASTAWSYPVDNEIWTKCPKCMKQNRIPKEFSSFRPTVDAPYKTECSGCRATIMINRCTRAHKNWKKPEG